MASTFSPPLRINFPYIIHQNFAALSGSEAQKFYSSKDSKPRRRRRRPISCAFRVKFRTFQHRSSDIYEVTTSSSVSRVRVRVIGDGSVNASHKDPTAADGGGEVGASSASGESYVGLFVRMLGLDNDPLDRELAVATLWKYSLAGKECVDSILQYHGCVNLVVNLLKSDSSATCEAAAGLLESISSIDVYRNLVAESGAIEELTGLLSRPFLTSEVKEQVMCTLWNLSVDENHRAKIATADNLQLLVKSLDDEDPRVKEPAAGVLANLALSRNNHNLMVEAGVIPKLANLSKIIKGGYQVIKKEAQKALLELAKDDYYRILILEEGLIKVPLVGASAYRSFTPDLYSRPRLPDGTEIKGSPKPPSKFGASEVLLGLTVGKDFEIDEAKANAMVAQAQQHFLARMGAIESDAGQNSQDCDQSDKFTLLPWSDGAARLVLILGLEDELAISRAAESIADSSINEHMRITFKEAGAVKDLVRLLDHRSDSVKHAVARALERLSVSPAVCQVIEAQGAVHPLVGILKQSRTSETLMEKTLDVLARILDPSKEMRSKFYDGPVNGSNSARKTENSGEMPATTANPRKEVVDFDFLARLIEIMKSSSLHLQRKAASVLEFAAIADPSVEIMISLDIASALQSVFQQKVPEEGEDFESQEPEKYALQLEELGSTVSSASRLLTKLLEREQFAETINSEFFSKSLREILKSDIPFHHKDWVAACLVKLSSSSSTREGSTSESHVNTEVTMYETIPRLLEQLRSSCSPQVQEAAVVELNRIISEGVVDSTRAVAAKGGIFLLVRLLEEGSDRAVEAAITILHNLSMANENHPAILAAGALPVLRRIVLAERPQWTRALRLLRNLPT